MRTLKPVVRLATALIVSLNLGCQTNIEPIIVEQCSPFFGFVEVGGKRYIDPDKSRCFCRDYKRSKEYIGPEGNEQEHPIDHCNLVIGYPIASYEDVVYWDETARRICTSQNAKNKK